MGLFKEHSALAQRIDVRRLGLWMPAKTTNPVVEVIDGDEQDVRPFSRKATDCRCKENAKAQKSRLVKSCGHT